MNQRVYKDFISCYSQLINASPRLDEFADILGNLAMIKQIEKV
jgi:hypothetical protein